MTPAADPCPTGSAGAQDRPGDPLPTDPWHDAQRAAALFAIDPHGLGGVLLKCSPGPARDQWLGDVRALLPEVTPLRRVPANVSPARLLGGLDLGATLQSGRPIAERGLLAEADGGVLIVPSAERLPGATSALITMALDRGDVRLERDGLATTEPSRFGVIAIDEGRDGEEATPAALADRLAFHLLIDGLRPQDRSDSGLTRHDIALAAQTLRQVDMPEAAIAALCAAADAMGITSLRAILLATRAARAAAALYGRQNVSDDDIILAGRLVLGPRATRLPPAEDDDAQQPDPPPLDDNQQTDDSAGDPSADQPLEDRILAATEAALPPGLLALLRLSGQKTKSKASPGRAGQTQKSNQRGRPIGALRGIPKSGQRLNVIETLRAAAPWQRLRRQQLKREIPADRRPRIEVRKDDFRITRQKARAATVTIFVVDASGSAALHRLAEAKGAVELLLADCYIRRDCVALISFRGQSADVLLPPTRSLARVKRCLSALPGGGGTPLAAGLDAALLLADGARRKGHTPALVVLTDGRANVARTPGAGKAQAADDAAAAARAIRLAGFKALLVDTSPQRQPQAQHIAVEMGAVYLPMPHAGAAELSVAVKFAGGR